MHDVIGLGLPLLAILAGILFNRSDVRRLEDKMDAKFAEMNKRFDKIDGRFDVLEAELRYFHGVTGKLDGRVQALEKK